MPQLHQMVHDNAVKANDNEQYSRMSNDRIFGVPEREN